MANNESIRDFSILNCLLCQPSVKCWWEEIAWEISKDGGNQGMSTKATNHCIITTWKWALLKVAVCHMPQQASCFLISPAGLVNSHLIRMQITLIRLICRDLFSCDQGTEWEGNEVIPRNWTMALKCHTLGRSECADVCVFFTVIVTTFYFSEY